MMHCKMHGVSAMQGHALLRQPIVELKFQQSSFRELVCDINVKQFPTIYHLNK